MATAVVVLLLLVAGQAQAQTGAVATLSGQAEALGAPVTGTVKSVPTAAGVSRVTDAQAHELTAAVKSTPVVGQGVETPNGVVGRTVSAIRRDTGRIAGSTRSSVGQMAGSAVRDGGLMTDGASHDLGSQIITGAQPKVTPVPAAISVMGGADSAGAATSARAGVRSLMGEATSLQTQSNDLIQAALPVRPALIEPKTIGLLSQVWVFIGSGVDDLSSQLTRDVLGLLSPVSPFVADLLGAVPGSLLQDLLGAVPGVSRGTAGWLPEVRVTVATSGHLERFSTPSVASFINRANGAAGPVPSSLTPGRQAVALGAGARAGAAVTGSRTRATVTGNVRLPSEAPGGNGALSSSGGVGLPLVLLVLTLLIPASGWRLRLAAAGYRPAIFASPLERPG